MLAVKPQSAAADCVVGESAPTVTCFETTTTNNTTNTNGNSTNPPDREYLFNGNTTFPGNVTGTVRPAATVNGFGLAITNNQTTTPDISFTNAGTVTLTTGTPTAGGSAALNLNSSGGNITYSGSGNVSGGTFGDGVQITAGGGLVTMTSTGTISSAAGDGVQITGGGGLVTMTNTGTISSAAAYAIEIDTSGGGSVTYAEMAA